MKVPNELVERIYAGIKAHVGNKPRAHLGASVIGAPCDRSIWYGFRWIAREDFDGRMLRLFKRGQDEEAWIIEDMRRAGLKIDAVNPSTKKQFGFDDGHFSGSCDGIILSGVPDAPDTKHILEVKTHSLKSFTDLEKNGVEKSKPQHYAQMQVYMGMLKIERALYVSVCKDNDQIYTERVRFDKEAFEALCERAQRIIASDRIPEPLSADPTWFECKFCSASELCHKQKQAQETHCRTCSHITFTRDGKTTCAHWEAEIPFDAQLDGCESHILHPDLVPWTMDIKDSKVSWVINGVSVGNGEPAPGVFTSREILADAKACASLMGDKFAMDCRDELGGRICS